MTVTPPRVVYAAVYADGVRRTNIYLSEVEQAALDARAAAEGTTRSEIVRAIVDRELNLGPEEAPEVDSALAESAGELAAHARALSADDPDLSIS
ncbi:MAG: ribbon-helix-helix protein, CopG family [Actinobacteria bacterium]|nr:ribbon-helix-helix protein, CopG family [Actinomycetota bacterium]